MAKGMMGGLPKLPHAPSLGGRHVGTSFKSPMKGFGGATPFHYLPAGANTQGFTRGGPVGYAKGGPVIHNFTKGASVPGKGNTDTVPAMLTPGEFVIKKKSAQAHKKLVKAINDSDGGPIAGHRGG